jgi:hypothetical protein
MYTADFQADYAKASTWLFFQEKEEVTGGDTLKKDYARRMALICF